MKHFKFLTTNAYFLFCKNRELQVAYWVINCY